MDNLKSMIFGANPKAVKWLGMGRSAAAGHDDDDHRGNDRMFVHAEAATQVLQPLGDQPINLISIFGAARQGKSFLMNLLADQQDLFKISNLREPCTQGVDLSGHFLPLPKFSALNGCTGIPSSKSESQTLQIGFVDAEGQGDRDITYDSRLVSPVLLSSKVVIFNWKDSLQADRILNLLAVLARAAQGIELADGDNSKVFGHLHIVFRDWSFVDSSPDEVFKDLFTKEKGRSEEVNIRNLARVNLLEAFESINVWLFPAPVANTANLKDKIRFEQLQAPFQEKLRDLRKMLSTQLQHPMLFGGKPLTARLLSQMMPALVDTLNSDQVIMPESIYSSLVRAEAKATKDECEKSIAAYCEAAAAEEVVSTTELKESLRRDIEFLVTEAIDKMKGTPALLQKEMRDGLEAYADKEIRLIIQANNERIAETVSKEIDLILKNLQEECSLIEQDAIPMRNDLLRRRCADVLASEINRLEVLPLGAKGKQGREVELARIRQHATVLFDKVEVANEKAIQKAGSAINEMIRNGKTRMTRDMHATLDKIFSERAPITVTTLQSGLDTNFRDLLKELNGHLEENPYLSVDFMEDISHHKTHLAEELNRRYYLEVRQIVNEIGFKGKDEVGKEVALRLDGKLPLPDDAIKRAVDEAVDQVKAVVAKALHGWTILKADIAAKCAEIEKLGDVYAYEYLRRNNDLRQDMSARQEHQQYDDLKAEFVDEFQREMKSVEFPVPEAKIDAVFTSSLKDLISEFISLETTSKSFSASTLYERLSADCKPDLENQKILNRLALEKQEAVKLAEKERQMREQESMASRKKEEQMNELKTYVQKSLGERDEEAKRLQDQLRSEAERAQQLRREVEEMRCQTREAEMQKAEIEMHAREQALREEMARRQESEGLKQQLEELRLQAAEMELERQHLQLKAQEEARKHDESRQLAQTYEEMRRRAAELEAEKYALERLAREESQRRAQAEQAARAAAEAAALSARAAIEAAADETDPEVDSGTRGHHLAAARAQQRASPPVASDAKKRKVNHAPPTAATSAEKPKTSGLSVLEEARLAAKAEMERRIQERTKTLTKKKK